MGSLLDLANRVDRLVGRIDKAALELERKAATAILDYLLDHTPVDTSKAVSNWRVSNSGGMGREIDAHVLGQHGSTAGASIAVAREAGYAKIAGARADIPLLIYNPVPYIKALNEGSSAQAPAGFVEAAVLVGRNVARNAGLNLKVVLG